MLKIGHSRRRRHRQNHRHGTRSKASRCGTRRALRSGPRRAEALSSELSSRPPVVSIDEMIERCDLAVEAASQAALPEFVPKALARGRDMLIMSVGGLLGREEWFRQANEKGCHIYVPSGAIAGLDGIKSASIGRIESARAHQPQAGRGAEGIEVRRRPKFAAR